MKFNYFAFYDRSLILFTGGVILFSFIANLFRLSQVPLFYEGEYFDIILFGFIAIAMARTAISLRIPSTGKGFIFLLSVFLLLILLIGLARGTADPIGGLKYYTMPIAAFFLLAYSRFMLFFYSSTYFWSAVVISHFAGLALYYGSLFGAVYPGIGVQSIAYASIYFFVKRRYALFTLSILMVVLEGKRSILLAIMVALAFVPLARVKYRNRFFYTAFATTLFITILTVTFGVIANIDGYAIVNRLNYLNPLSERFDIYVGSSGRFGELVSYWRGKTLSDVIIGSGSGFQYVWDLGFESQQMNEVKGYFHMSLLNYVAAGGLTGFLLSIYVAIMPFKSLKLSDDLDLRTIAFSFSLFSITLSFFGFNLATDAFSWFALLGPMMLLGRAHQTRSSPRYRNSSVCAVS